MSVGDDNLPQGQAVFLQPGEDFRNVVSGIDDHGFMRCLIAQDGAIAVQRTDGKAFEDHVPRITWKDHAGYNAAMRIYAAVGALLGWFALALQLYLMLVQSPAGGVAMLGTLITFFSFFTILTNLLVALVFTATVFRPGSGWMEFLPSPVGAGRHGCLHRHRRDRLPVYCCDNYGIRRARNGLPTYFCIASFPWLMSCIGCCLHHGRNFAGRMPLPGWPIPACTWCTSWRGAP